MLGYAGKLTAETTSSFESIHDDYATQKLNECIIGKLTDKAAGYIKKQAKQQAAERAKSSANSDIFLQKQTWQVWRLVTAIPRRTSFVMLSNVIHSPSSS